LRAQGSVVHWVRGRPGRALALDNAKSLLDFSIGEEPMTQDAQDDLSAHGSMAAAPRSARH